MLKLRLLYFCLIIITIVVGILSRQYIEIPMFIGDVLWGLMIFLGLRMLFVNLSINTTVVIGLLYCYATEFSQLYKAPWIDSLRNTVIGGLVLGHDFIWGDLLSYTVGIGLGVLTELSLRKLTTSLYVRDEM